MRRHALWLGVAALLSCSDDSGDGLVARPSSLTCKAPARPDTGASVRLERQLPNVTLQNPVLALQRPGDSSRWYFVEQHGLVKRVANSASATAADTVVDISARVVDGGERGLLGMAFHPSFATNGEVYLSYTANDGGLVSRISRFHSADGGLTIDPASETVVLKVAQPFDNHNGGNIAFGPDGFLYIGLGDGGSGGDPQGNGQNVNVLLGKMLRIDINDHGTAQRPYGIPASNPFVNGGGRPEIYAYGLRNPWRWSFDRDSGDLWVGDVGQGLYEEVDRVELGGNYGWNTREGKHCYSPATGCSTTGLIDPLVEYGHDVGQSITGGYVYRGTALPTLAGVFIYGDYVSGRIWGVVFNDRTGLPEAKELMQSGGLISAFAQDQSGEVYVVDYNGFLSKIVPTAPVAAAPNAIATQLSATGCVDAGDPTRPAAGLIPYDVNSPLWSDGAEKERYFSIPDGAQITAGADGDWTLPVGSVVMKTFKLDGKRVETRLLVRHDDGDWAGYSYEWNDAGTEATLLPAGKRKAVGDKFWTYPSRSQCLQCHTTAAGRTLGLESAQLNRILDYPGAGAGNQLTVLHRIGLVTGLPEVAGDTSSPMSQPVLAPLEQLPRLADPRTDTGSLEERAKAYLHSNCSACHRPEGATPGVTDLRYTTALAAMGICNATPNAGDLGVAGARLLLPGDPGRSLLSLRMHALDVNRMPRLGSAVVDPSGTALVDSWVRSLTSCP